MPKQLQPFQNRIYLVRDTRVMLDSDLAELYGVKTGDLIQAVKRNAERFPSDFMYRLTKQEVTVLLSQIVISKSERRGGRRTTPYVFTEQGVAMLSSVLRSKQAIQVNIHIMRTFVRMRELAVAHTDLWLKIDAMEKKYDNQFQVVFKALKLLIEKPKDDPGSQRRF